MNIITVNIQKKEFSTFELHLFEHVYTRKVEQMLKENNLDNLGILINAETFISYLNLTLAFYDKKLINKLLRLLNDIKFDDCEHLLQSEHSRIKEEVKVIDLTEEDELLYSTFRIDNLDIMSIYEYVDDIDIKDKIKVMKKIEKEKSIYVFQGDRIYSILNTKNLDNKVIINDKYQKNLEHMSFGACFNVFSIKEYFIISMMSFILGKTSESVIDKFILSKNDLYYGYTFDVILNKKYILLLLLDNNASIKIINSMLRKSFDEIISKKDFVKFKNTFITNFYLNEFPSKFFGDICNLNINVDVSILNIEELVKSITFDDIKEMFDSFKNKVLDNYVNS